MTRCAAVLAVLLVGCDSKPEPPRRSVAVFVPVATSLVAEEIAERKAKGEKEVGSVEMTNEIVLRYALALAVDPSEATRLKSGPWDDAGALKRAKAAMETIDRDGVTGPRICKRAMGKVRSGEWKSGLELEFAARILECEVSVPRK